MLKMNRSSTWLAVLLFAAGVVSGMVAQRILDTPAVEPIAAAPAVLPPGASREAAAPDPARWERHATGEEPDTSREHAESREDGMASLLSPMDEPASEIDDPRGDAPWGRGAWTNREAWLEQRRVEREERVNRMRSNLIERTKLSEEQTVRFDVLVTSMNLRLQQQTRLWQEALDSGLMSRAEIRARAMQEVGAAVALTYDELDRNLPAEWRSDTTNESVNLWTFIDPDIWRAMRPLMGGRGRPNPPPR